MMKPTGDNLIKFKVQENIAGRSRKAALSEVLRGFMEKTVEIVMIRVRCNLIIDAASGSMNSPGISIWNEVEIKKRLCH
jgi:hypothetical protein